MTRYRNLRRTPLRAEVEIPGWVLPHTILPRKDFHRVPTGVATLTFPLGRVLEGRVDHHHIAEDLHFGPRKLDRDEPTTAPGEGSTSFNGLLAVLPGRVSAYGEEAVAREEAFELHAVVREPGAPHLLASR